MSYYDENFYNEPSEFEQQVDKFKAALLNSVRDEHKAEVERLRQENAELQPIKQRMNQIERDRRNEKLEVEQVKRDALKEAKKLRLAELLQDYKRVIYTIDYDFIRPPKCDMCDSDRMIEYTTPLGKSAKEDCTCKESTRVYRLREVEASAIHHNSPEHGISVSYYDNERDDRVSSYQMYKSGTSMEETTIWTYFTDKTDAERFCEWCTQKEIEKT